ncbi:Ig-like domain-containing protein [Bacillus xiapuensis]|uniref:Ig-like domain-containing protein n=1 Tax=Bacillus xiapuensis TaxID=2014075 RepID=A0ABU6N4Z2_9BACI|nr:Ig-like domain-containing protein [Bacillus xiapuensis]
MSEIANRKSLIWVLAGGLLLLSVLFFSTNAFSLDGAKHLVLFNGDQWDMESADQPNWYTNGNSVTFQIDLMEDFKNSHPEGAERPFEVKAAYPGATELKPKITEVKDADKRFQGEYAVTIPLPADSKDGDLDITIDMVKDNTWKIPEQTSSFTIKRDTVKPVVDVQTEFQDGAFADGGFTKMPVSMKLKVEDDHFVPDQDIISIIKDGISLKAAPVWEDGQTTLTFDQIGYYEVTIAAVDKAGNKSAVKKVTFGIEDKGPRLTIVNNRGNGYYNQPVQLQVSDDFNISDATAVVEKDGETTTKSFARHGKTALLEFSAQGVYNVKVTVRDRKNPDGYNLGETAFTIDTTKPELIFTGLKDQGSDKMPRDFGIDVKDANLDEDSVLLKVSRDGNMTTTFQGITAFANHSLTEDGIYSLELSAADKAGNTSEKAITFTIDQTAPVLNISEVPAFVTAPKEVIFTAEDLTLDLSKTVLKVVKDGAEYKEPIAFSQAGTTAVAKHSFKDEGKYELSFKATDKLGNVSPEKTAAFTIDNTPPVVTISTVEDGGKYDENQNIKISVQDQYLDQYNVTVKKDGIPYSIKPLVQGGDIATTEQVFDEDGVYEVTVTSKDKAGNEKTVTKTFTIDKSSPEIHFSDSVDGEHYNTNRTVVISVYDYTFDPQKTTVKVLKDGMDITEKILEDWKISDPYSWIRGGEMRLPFKEEGDYQISVTSEDFFGKLSTKQLSFVIDKTAPKIAMTGIDEGAFVKKGEVTIAVEETHYQTDQVKVTVQKNGTDKKETFTSTGTHSELQLPFTDDGDYVIAVEAVDKAGNVAQAKTLSFTVDTIAPKISIVDKNSGSEVKNNSYSSKDKEVSIVVEEHNFNNNHVDVKVTENGKIISIGDWENNGETSTLDYEFKEDREYTIMVAATDEAGNKAAEKSVTFTIDHINPELAISGVEDQQNYKSKTATFTVTDTNLDLSQSSLKVTRNGKPYSIGWLALTSKTKGELSYNFKDEGNYEVRLSATDKAGRESSLAPVSFIIDHTKPVVKVEGVDEQSFNPESRNVTISVDELNYSTNQVELDVTKDGQPFTIGTMPVKQHSNLSYNFSKDGLYSIFIQAEDKAGNGPVFVKRTFTIDKTKPAIEITGVEQGAYYNKDKLVKATIQDRNFDINKIVITKDGRSYPVGGFTVNGDAASFSHNFSKEGEYQIVVDATDKAGNHFSKQMKFTIDKTKPVITPKFRGQNRVIKNVSFINEIFTPEFALDHPKEDSIVSVVLNGKNVGKSAPTASKEMEYTYTVLARDKAGNETTLTIHFTLDTTKPKLTISGVLDGFFKKNLSPVVTYSDVHLDKSKTSVTLNGKPFVSGVLNAEGVYVLKAKVTDLARNFSSRTIVFTIDKSAPVVKFNEPISQQYFKEDLIPKLRIQDMSSYDIIAQTLDGEDYELGQPITREGKHVLFFEVKDKAGNIKQLSVEFILDKTKPTVVFEGVKKGAKYYDPVRLSVHLDNPNDTITNFLVNGKPAEDLVKTKDDNGNTVLTTSFSKIEKYNVKVVAYDKAGNKKTENIPFEIAQKGAMMKFYENKRLFAGSIVGMLALLGMGVTVAVRSRKEDVSE